MVGPGGHDSGAESGRKHVHLDLLVPPAARNLVRHKVDAVHLVRMSRQVHSDLERLQVPQLRAHIKEEGNAVSTGNGSVWGSDPGLR